VSWGLDREVLRRLRLGWPVDYGRPGAGHWVDQILTGMRSHGVRVERRPIPQTFAETLLIEVDGRSGRRWVAIDYNDSPAVHIDLAAEALVYFKLQFAQQGYEFGSVVAGGYVPANQVVYRYLPLLRAIRARRTFRYDVYGRFGLKRGGGEIRRKAVELLSARADFSYEGNLFRYPGGPPKVPYRKYMFEIPYAKVCVHMPGAGDLCFRLIDYLAVGACIVGPPPRVRLPVPQPPG